MICRRFVGPENSLPPGAAQAHQAALLMRRQTPREVRNAHSTTRTPLPRRMRMAIMSLFLLSISVMVIIDSKPNYHRTALTGPELRPIESSPWIGGDLCLDFVNTAGSRTRAPAVDRLEAYGDLVRWSRLAGTIDDSIAEELLRLAEAEPASAARVLSRAKALREAIYRVFSARADGRAAEASDLNALSSAAAEAAAHRALAPAGFGFRYVWPREGARLERVLWPIAAAAVELATSDRVTRVKECATANCNWLFVDLSRNRSRRWCQMRECGNRAKQRRYHAREKAGSVADRKNDARAEPGMGRRVQTGTSRDRRAFR